MERLENEQTDLKRIQKKKNSKEKKRWTRQEGGNSKDKRMKKNEKTKREAAKKYKQPLTKTNKQRIHKTLDSESNLPRGLPNQPIPQPRHALSYQAYNMHITHFLISVLHIRSQCPFPFPKNQPSNPTGAINVKNLFLINLHHSPRTYPIPLNLSSPSLSWSEQNRLTPSNPPPPPQPFP